MAADSDYTSPARGTHRFSILKADGKNFITWAIHMEDYLYDSDLWEYVNGDIKELKPKDEKDLDGQNELAAWRQKDRKALNAIRYRLGESVLMSIRTLRTSKAAWDKISSLFQKKGRTHVLSIKKKITHFKISEDDDIEEKVRTFQNLHEDLVALGKEYDDEFLIDCLLMALPDSWESWIDTLADDDSPDFSKVVTQLLSRAARRKARQSTEEDQSPIDETALYAKGKDVKKSKFRKGITCYNCDKEGHIASECRGPKKEGHQSGGKSSRAHHARDNDESDDEDTFEFNVRDSEQAFVARGEQWLADSATQSHIVRDRSLFTTYYESDGTISGAGKCGALGRGTVTIFFLIQGRQIKINLLNVIHAPGISSNLISMT